MPSFCLKWSAELSEGIGGLYRSDTSKVSSELYMIRTDLAKPILLCGTDAWEFVSLWKGIVLDVRGYLSGQFPSSWNLGP